MSGDPPIRALAICGPTSTGKSELAFAVAEAAGGEIVNADSRQVYRGLAIGTGWPAPDSMRRVPHHLYGFVDPCERYSAGDYADDARAAIVAVIARGRVPIVVGGTGLYIEALAGSMPLDRPVADDATRARVRREAQLHPPDFLRAWLETVDRAAAKRVDGGDRYRTLRALESSLASRNGDGNPSRPRRPEVAMRIVLLRADRDVLAERIVARVRRMFDEGLVEEAIEVWRRCPNAPALTGIGFAEALAFRSGEATRAEAIQNTIERTKRYAKRQATWFRRIRGAIVIDGMDGRAAVTAVAVMARECAPNA